MLYRALFLPILLTLTSNLLAQQQLPTAIPTSVDSKLVFDAAGPKQRGALSSVILIACPQSGAGTGFLLESGMVITNFHVTSPCNAAQLIGILNDNTHVSFSSLVSDERRDLAALKPVTPLKGGLKLASDTDPLPGEAVSTWGYPLLYDGATPLLSVGYVSGFRMAPSANGGSPVKHIVVNAAFNHGNSGGPVLRAQNNEVLGVVVLTYHFHPPAIRNIIDFMSHQTSGLVWQITPTSNPGQPAGPASSISEAQLTAAVLDEFYQTTQVMIGEAISVNELKAFLKEKELSAALTHLAASK